MAELDAIADTVAPGKVPTVDAPGSVTAVTVATCVIADVSEF